MPTYDYRCESCQHELEAFQGIHEERLTYCPACGEATLKRRIGAGAGIIFKGTGFYETDYKRGDKVKGRKPVGGSESSGGGESSGGESSSSGDASASSSSSDSGGSSSPSKASDSTSSSSSGGSGGGDAS